MLVVFELALSVGQNEFQRVIAVKFLIASSAKQAKQRHLTAIDTVPSSAKKAATLHAYYTVVYGPKYILGPSAGCAVGQVTQPTQQAIWGHGAQGLAHSESETRAHL